MAPVRARGHGRLGAAVKVFTGVLLSMSLCSRSWVVIRNAPRRRRRRLARADAHGLGELVTKISVADLSGAATL